MDSFWLSCLKHFEKELSTQQFNTWIKPLQFSLSSAKNELILVAPNRFVLQWIKDNFLLRIEQMAETHFSKSIHFQIKLADNEPEKPAAIVEEDGVIVPPPLAQKKTVPISRRPAIEKPQSRLNPSFTFDTFVNGKANQLARAAAIQVAECPGVAYNPLFI